MSARWVVESVATTGTKRMLHDRLCSATGGPLDPVRYAATLRLALGRAKVDKPMRPFHDGRHTSITNAAAAGVAPAALMARAGHSDFKTTQGYIDLAGETFREEAELLEERLFGQKSGQK
jgi:integrase